MSLGGLAPTLDTLKRTLDLGLVGLVGNAAVFAVVSALQRR